LTCLYRQGTVEAGQLAKLARQVASRLGAVRERSMRNIPVDLSGFRLMVSEEPAVKMKRNGKGEQEPVADTRTGAVLYLVAVFVKAPGQRGEEIRVTLPADPGEGFAEGSLIEFVSPTVSPYQFENERGEQVSGISWRAEGLKPVRAGRASAAA
jgi:hypothetical protein